MKDSFIDLAIESWKLSKVTDELTKKVNFEDQRKYARKISWFNDKLESVLNESNIRFVILENQKFDTGMPVKALNIEEFTRNENLMISNMLEPIVMNGDNIERTGIVMLKEIN